MGQEKINTVARRFDIDPNGDLLLKVGAGIEAVDILVSSTSISTSSDVFAKMLFWPFQESVNKVINMPEDSPKEVLLFSFAAHGQVSQVDDLDADNIRGLIMLSDKYMCHLIVLPYLLEILWDYIRWIDHCTENLAEQQALFPQRYAGLRLEDIIVFAVVFEAEDLFARATELHHVLSCAPLVPSGYETELPVLWSGDLHLFGLRIDVFPHNLEMLTLSRCLGAQPPKRDPVTSRMGIDRIRRTRRYWKALRKCTCPI